LNAYLIQISSCGSVHSYIWHVGEINLMLSLKKTKN
jgi:hypothetical protein